MNQIDKPKFLMFRQPAKNPTDQIEYDALYRQANLAQIHSFYNWFIKKMRVSHKGTLLDVACGEGSFVKVALSKGFVASGTDISYIVFKNADQDLGNRFFVSNGEYLPVDNNSFDYITSIGSLEHYEDMGRGLDEMARALKKTGKAFILVPNLFSAFNNIWHAWRTGELAADDQPIQRYGTRQDWTTLIKSHGFEISRVYAYERAWPKSIKDVQYYFQRPKELVNLILSPIIPLNLCWCFVFECIKS